MQETCQHCKKRPRVEGKKGCEPCLKVRAERAKKRYRMVKARKAALESKDTGEKRKYTKHVSMNDVQIQASVNELELFIAKLPTMTAQEYLEARVNLIKAITMRSK